MALWNPFAARVPLILQSEAPECGIACVAMIASFHGFLTDLSAIRTRLSPSMRGVTLRHIANMAASMKMALRGVRAPLESLHLLQLPAILHWDLNHFVVLTHVTRGRLHINNPATGRRTLTLAEASRHYSGVAAELRPNADFVRVDERQKISAWQLLAAARGLSGPLTQVLLLSLVLEVCAIAAPFFVQIVVDRVVIGRDTDLLALLGIGFALLALLQVAVTAMRAWLGIYVSTHLNLRLLDGLFAQLLRLPLAWFEKRHIGDIVSRFRSVDAIQRTLSVGFLETAVDGLMVLLTLIVMIWYSPTLSAVVVGAAIAYGLVRWAVFGPQRRALDEQLVHEGRSATHFIETLRGMLAIKLNLHEQERRHAYQNLVVEQTNAQVRAQNIGIVHRALHGIVFGLENVAIIWLGTLLVLQGQFSVGMLFGFLAFKLLFLSRINALVDKGIEFSMLDLHAERIADIALAKTDAPVDRGYVASPDQPLDLRAQGLGFSYGVEGAVLRNVDFQVRPGEMVAIVGPSGSGKSTLVKVLAGLLERTEGSLTANGRDVRDWDRAALRRRIGVVMTDDQLFVGTLEDNISFFDPQHQPELIRRCAMLAGIDRDIDAMPMQYNTIVGSIGNTLSGGQRQRILLARALYRSPEVVFLDEAFDQLDLALESEVTARLRACGYGLVVVSHRPDSVRQVDRTVLLGLVAESAAPAEAAEAIKSPDSTAALRAANQLSATA